MTNTVIGAIRNLQGCALLRATAGLAALTVVCGVSYSPNIAAQTLDDARNKGLAWLIANQRNDGSWAAKPESAIATTATAVQAFKQAGIKPTSYPYASGLTWLMNAKPESVDSMARQVAAFPVGGPNVDQKFTSLSGAANSVGTWGSYAGFDTGYPDTPLVLAAMRTFGLSWSSLQFAVYCEILPSQVAGGGWTYFNPRSSGGPAANAAAIVPSAYNVIELKAINAGQGWDSNTCPSGTGAPASIVSAINGGRAFLLTKRNADGGFGQGGVSTVIDTALVYAALRSLDPMDSYAAAALTFLLSRQDSSSTASRGSWNADPFQTALVLSVIPAPATPLADTDQDGIPDSVELALGKNPNVADSRSLAIGGGSNTIGLNVGSQFSAQMMQFVAFSRTLTASGGASPYS